MIEKLNNETISELLTELTEMELAHVSGGYIGDGSGNVGWCGTKPPGWHPWHPPVVGRS